MSNVDAVKDNSAIFSGISSKVNAEEDTSGRTDFLKLMITQLQNQNPLEPQENGEFLSQLAQFSTVEGIQTMNDEFTQLSEVMQSSYALQATSLVGRSVQAQTNVGHVPVGGQLMGTLELASTSSNVKINITSETGALVKTINLGVQPSGDVAFSWNGIKDDGTAMPAGNYYVAAEASFNGEPEAVPVFMNTNVDSVTLSANGEVVLNLSGVGPVALSDVKQIN